MLASIPASEHRLTNDTLTAQKPRMGISRVILETPGLTHSTLTSIVLGSSRLSTSGALRRALVCSLDEMTEGWSIFRTGGPSRADIFVCKLKLKVSVYEPSASSLAVARCQSGRTIPSVTTGMRDMARELPAAPPRVVRPTLVGEVRERSKPLRMEPAVPS